MRRYLSNTGEDARLKIVGNAHWGPAHRDRMTYSEGRLRWMGIGHPFLLPLTCDCSAKATINYNWADAPDPNKTGYRWGYTGTLLRGGREVSLVELLPGDLGVYGPYDGVHVVTAVITGADPICESMGQQGDPHFVSNSVLLSLGSVRWMRYPTKRLHPVHKRAQRIVHVVGSRRFYVPPISLVA